MTKKLERTTFEASRAAEYFDKRNLAALTGVSAPEFPAVVVKELGDNALDAAEAAGVAPKIWIASVRDGRALAIAVEDNGPGIRPEVVRSVLNYNVRVSDKAAYRSPTRGAQGNALKTVVGIPYALGVRQPLTIEACGVHHEIEPSIDPAGNVRIAHEESNGARTKGTRVELQVAPADAAWWSGRPIQWARSFAIFNPHAQISYQAVGEKAYGPSIYKPTASPEDFRKYRPTDPTSAHWYSPDSLKVLVFSHVAKAERGGRDLPLGEFVRQFAGLTSTAKAKAVTKQLPDFHHLSDFRGNERAVATLLGAMQEASKVPKAASLGSVGKEHFEAFFRQVYTVREFAYKKAEGILASGLPITFELALATLDIPGHLYMGVNFSPTFGDPLEGTQIVGPAFTQSGISSFLAAGYALPSFVWHLDTEPASVAVAAHIVTPAPLFLDRGKTRLNLEGA